MSTPLKTASSMTQASSLAHLPLRRYIIMSLMSLLVRLYLCLLNSSREAQFCLKWICLEINKAVQKFLPQTQRKTVTSSVFVMSCQSILVLNLSLSANVITLAVYCYWYGCCHSNLDSFRLTTFTYFVCAAQLAAAAYACTATVSECWAGLDDDATV